MATSSTWNRRLGRLVSMNRYEMLDRLRQCVTARVNALRYGSNHDSRVGPEAGLAEPKGRFFFAATEIPEICAKLQEVFPSQADAIILRAERICQHRFQLLGYNNLDYGTEIDWHLDVVHGMRAPRIPWFKVKYLDFEGLEMQRLPAN